MRGSRERDRGPDRPPPPPPWKNHKKGFLAILVSIPRKITKLQSQHSILAQRNAFNGVSLVGRWWSAYSGIGFFLLFSHHEQKQHNNKKSCHTCSWTRLDPRMTHISLVDRNYKYQQFFPTEEVHYFLTIDADISLHLSHRRRYFFTFLAF